MSDAASELTEMFSSDADPAVERAKRKQQCALGYRVFAAQRWGDLGDGHISARDPERTDCFWLLPAGVSYHAATVADLVLVGPKGDVVEGDAFINPAAYHIHHPVLMARPEAVAAAHVHTPWGTPFSALVRPFEPITQEACFFFEDHALFDDEEVDIQGVAGGQRIAQALGDTRAIILRNHGLLTVGTSVGGAVASFVIMERVAEAHIKVPNAVPISADAARMAKAGLGGDVGAAFRFSTLVKRHIPDRSVVGH